MYYSTRSAPTCLNPLCDPIPKNMNMIFGQNCLFVSDFEVNFIFLFIVWVNLVKKKFPAKEVQIYKIRQMGLKLNIVMNNLIHSDWFDRILTSGEKNINASIYLDIFNVLMN